MFTCTWLFGIVLFCAVAFPCKVRAQHAAVPNITTCEQFERNTYFHPYAILDSMWKVFYFWSNQTEVYPIVFNIAAKNRVAKFRETFEAINPGVHVEWGEAIFFMNPRPGIEVLFLTQVTRGAFRAIVLKEKRTKERPFPEPSIKFADVRMKLIHRFIGMMCCEDLTAFALVRIHELPKTEEACEKAAATIGYTGHPGRSYLYLTKKRDEDEL